MIDLIWRRVVSGRRSIFFYLLVATAFLVAISGVNWMVPEAHAFKSLESEAEGHIQQTYRALDGIRVLDPFNGQELRFTSKAKREIKAANVFVDTGYSGLIGIGFLSSHKHVDSETFADATDRLVKLKQDVVKELNEDPPKGKDARWWLGEALHTLQDYYSHTTWVNYAVVQAGKSPTDTRLGKQTFNDVPPGAAPFCGNDFATITPGVLDRSVGATSGYFPLPNPCAAIAAGKCRHGLSGLCDGINKDDPRWPLYQPAFDLARQSTVEYVELILNDPAIRGNRAAIRALLGIENSTLGIVIDDTASMSEVISSVKATVRSLVDAVRFDESKRPDEYMLVRFGDPNVGPVFTTALPDQFLARVDAISVSGGDDCPEFSQQALLLAIASSTPDSKLYLFTDASAKDAALGPSVNARAKKKRIQIFPILTGSCSPYDPVYFSNARETGGQVFVTTADSIDEVFTLVEPQLRGDSVNILSRTENLDNTVVARSFPVDETMSNLTLSVAFDVAEGGPIFIPTVELVRPSGATVLETDPGVTLVTPGSGRAIIVENPEAGQWSARIGAIGETQYTVSANSLLTLRDFRFVEQGGRIAHEGFYPISGQPVAGTTPQALASLEGPFAGAGFALVDEAGSVLENLSLSLVGEVDDPDNYAGTVTLPSVPFFVIVSGNTSGGNAYQRQLAPLFRSQPIEITPSATTDFEHVPDGVTTTIRYEVTNYGDPADLTVNATVSHGSIAQITPSTLTLGAGETAEVDVDVAVAVATESGTRLGITVTAEKTDQPEVNNVITDTRVVFPEETLPPAAAVLPSSRSAQVSNLVTAFATIINVGTSTGARCSISPVTDLPIDFFFQATDPATNAVVGAVNVGVDIPAGASRSFVFAVTPTAAFDPVELELDFECRNSDAGVSLAGLNTLLLSASDTPVPDVVALGATLSNDGIVRLTGDPASGAFSVATVNLGAGADITVSTERGSGNPPVLVNVCETDPASGSCISDIGATVTTDIGSNETPTFGVFVQASSEPIPLEPATNRIIVRFADASGAVRGATSVAVTTDIPAATSSDSFAGAINLVGGSGTATASNEGMTKEPGEPDHAGNAGGASLWWRWTAPSDGTLTIDTVGSGFDTTLGVYTGTSVDSLSAVASNDDAVGLQSRVTFNIDSGTTYFIAVDGYNGQTGTVTLNWAVGS